MDLSHIDAERPGHARWLTRFHLDRDDGRDRCVWVWRIAHGTVPSGLVSLCWDSQEPSVSVLTSIGQVRRIHGHKGATELVWIDDPPGRRAPERAKSVSREAAVTS